MKFITLNLIIIFSFIILSKENYTEITITIEGKGKQFILSPSSKCFHIESSFNILPDEIYLNGLSKNPVNKSIYIFDNQSSINNITMKWNKKLNRTNNMFRNLTNITNIYFTKFDTSEVTDMRCMFYNCSGITSINLSNFNTSSVTHMGDMFSECPNLTFLDLSNFDTSLVTDMHHFIYQCFNLTSINLKNFNTSKVISMEGMFEATYKLKSLNLKKFNTSSVTSMLAMFHLYSLRNPVISNKKYLIHQKIIFLISLFLIKETLNIQ